MERADRAIITSGFVVAASTAGLAAVRSYGTVMFQLVVLGAWSIVARLSSGIFADRHQGLVWLVALAVNITVFSLIGIPGCFLEIVCRSGGHSSSFVGHAQTFLAYNLNGKDLPADHGAPLRVRVARQLGCKSVKYLHKLTLADSMKNVGDGRGSASPSYGYSWYAGI